MRQAVGALFVLLALSNAAQAQLTRGIVSGTVRDASGRSPSPERP